MIELAIDEVVDNGRVFDPKGPMPIEDIRSAVRDLFEELTATGVDHVLVGGVALLSYVEGRNTQDVDLIVAPADLARLSWNPVVRDRDFGEVSYHGLHVDLLLTTNALFAHVSAAQRTTISYAGLTVPCATREGLLLLKLYALPSLYRQGKLARAALYETDVLMLHQGADVDDERLLTELTRHLPASDVAELRTILAEQRSRRRFGH